MWYFLSSNSPCVFLRTTAYLPSRVSSTNVLNKARRKKWNSYWFVLCLCLCIYLILCFLWAWKDTAYWYRCTWFLLCSTIYLCNNKIKHYHHWRFWDTPKAIISPVVIAVQECINCVEIIVSFPNENSYFFTIITKQILKKFK